MVMVPNKFEKYIKEKFEARRIEPSLESWERISEQLEDKDESGRRGYFWYGIAASFVGLLIISVFFLSRTDEVVPADGVVGIENRKEAPAKAGPSDRDQEVFEEAKMPSIITNEVVESAKFNEEVVSTNTREIPVLAELAEDVVEDTPNKLNIDEKSVAETEIDLIDTKIAEVVAKVRLLEQDRDALTQAEVDSLLRNAQQDILEDRIFKSNRSVDALALLNEVEEELDQSFRDQIFEKLKTGFIKVRTAVADRNN